MATIYFGDFPDVLPRSSAHLTIVFTSATLPIKERWKNNGLSADFLAEYFVNFFPGTQTQPIEVKFEEIKSTISYIANELLENALKFNHNHDYSISIRLELRLDLLVFTLMNTVDPDKIEAFQAFLTKMLEGDPATLYFQSLEASALEENQTSSGLGFLTMLNDYNAKLGWRFETEADEHEDIILTTLVQVEI